MGVDWTKFANTLAMGMSYGEDGGTVGDAVRAIKERKRLDGIADEDRRFKREDTLARLGLLQRQDAREGEQHTSSQALAAIKLEEAKKAAVDAERNQAEIEQMVMSGQLSAFSKEARAALLEVEKAKQDLAESKAQVASNRANIRQSDASGRASDASARMSDERVKTEQYERGKSQKAGRRDAADAPQGAWRQTMNDAQGIANLLGSDAGKRLPADVKKSYQDQLNALLDEKRPANPVYEEEEQDDSQEQPQSSPYSIFQKPPMRDYSNVDMTQTPQASDFATEEVDPAVAAAMARRRGGR
jgi:hypothetical protein